MLECSKRYIEYINHRDKTDVKLVVVVAESIIITILHVLQKLTGR